MKNITILTVFLFLGELLMSFEGVSGRTHESPPRKRRQVTVGNYKSANSNNNNNYYDPYFLSSSPSAAYRRLEDHNELSSNSNRRTITKNDIQNSNNVLAEEFTPTKEKDYYDPFFYSVTAVASPYSGTRNRRNSHGAHAPSSSSVVRRDPRNNREVAYLYGRNTKDNSVLPNHPPHRFQYQSSHHQPHYRNPNVFLTKQQVTSQSRYNPNSARYYFTSTNSIDGNDRRNYYDQARSPTSYYRAGADSGRLGSSNSNSGDDGGAWSIQVGTQLKVNDDGRERNPEQFYVRDETRGGGGNTSRRYTSYYRK